VDSLRPESAIQLLPPAEREGLLSVVAQAVDGQGGRLQLQYETHLYMAMQVV